MTASLVLVMAPPGTTPEEVTSRRLDLLASEGRGRGLFEPPAERKGRSSAAGACVFEEDPLVCVQDTISAAVSPACLECLRPCGGILAQMSALLDQDEGELLRNHPFLQDQLRGTPAAGVKSSAGLFCSEACKDRGELPHLYLQRDAKARGAFTRHAEKHGLQHADLAALCQAKVLALVCRGKVRTELEAWDLVLQGAKAGPAWQHSGSTPARASVLAESAALLRSLLRSAANDAKVAEPACFDPERLGEVIGTLQRCTVKMECDHPSNQVLGEVLAGARDELKEEEHKQYMQMWRPFLMNALAAGVSVELMFESDIASQDMEAEVNKLLKTLDPDEGQIFPRIAGHALCRGVALMNHSCEPNIEVTWCLDGSHVLQMCALGSIAPGDELFISYADTDMQVEERRAFLSSNYGFECQCARCVREAALVACLFGKRTKKKRAQTDERQYEWSADGAGGYVGAVGKRHKKKRVQRQAVESATPEPAAQEVAVGADGN